LIFVSIAQTANVGLDSAQRRQQLDAIRDAQLPGIQPPRYLVQVVTGGRKLPEQRWIRRLRLPRRYWLAQPEIAQPRSKRATRAPLA